MKMDLVDRIERFNEMIYRNNAYQLEQEYISIAHGFSNIVDELYSDKEEVLKLKNNILEELLRRMSTHDYIMMADGLERLLVPVLEDIHKHMS